MLEQMTINGLNPYHTKCFQKAIAFKLRNNHKIP